MRRGSEALTGRRWVLALMVAVLILLAFGAHLPSSPRFATMGPDSGMFAYGGQQVLSGRLLYRDVWDHKPPGVFYIDALALLLGGGSPWAIWWVGVIWVTLTATAFFIIVSQLTDRGSAFLGSIVFLLTLLYPGYYSGGNLTEIYALLPQTLILGLTAAYLRSGGKHWLIGVGILTAAALLLKPTYVSTGLAAAAVIAFRDFRRRYYRPVLTHLAYIAAGWAIPVGVVVFYWWRKGALGDLWQAAVVFNLDYAEQGLSLRGIYGTLRTLLVLQPMATVFAAAVAGMAVFASRSWRPLLSNPQGSEVTSGTEEFRDAVRGPDWRTWALLSGLLAIPLELALLLVSGRNFGHYFLTPLPAMMVAATYLLNEVWGRLKGRGTLDAGSVAGLALLAALFGAWSIEVLVRELPRGDQLASITQPFWGSYTLDGMSQYVLQHTDPTDTVLVWGNHPDVNFLTGRRAPSRYLFAMHLFFAAPDGERRFEVFLQDLRNDPPALIFAQEVSSAGIPYFGAIGGDLCPGCIADARDGMQELKAYVEDQYSRADQIGDWLVFERNR